MKQYLVYVQFRRIIQDLNQHGYQGCVTPAEFWDITVWQLMNLAILLPLKFEDLLVIDTRCFKFLKPCNTYVRVDCRQIKIGKSRLLTGNLLLPFIPLFMCCVNILESNESTNLDHEPLTHCRQIFIRQFCALVVSFLSEKKYFFLHFFSFEN